MAVKNTTVWNGLTYAFMTLAEAAAAVAAGTHQAFRGQAGYEPGFRMFNANEFPFSVPNPTPGPDPVPDPINNPAPDPCPIPEPQPEPEPVATKAKKTPNK